MGTLVTIRPELLQLSSEQFQVLKPYFIVFGGIILTILASVLRNVSSKWLVFVLTLMTCGIGMGVSLECAHLPTLALFNGAMVSDSFSHLFNVLFLGSAGVVALMSFRYLDHEGIQHPEYFIMLLFAALGMMLMVSSVDLIAIFIALELMSLAVYVLVGFRRADRKSNEASMKYFILGSAASAVFLYGSALLYGSTGSLSIHQILRYLQGNPSVFHPVFGLGLCLIVFGFLFKVASVPFHMWMPDVYEGAPTPVTGFMTTGLKAAAFATFIRVISNLGYGKGLSVVLQGHLHDVLWVVAVLTMVVGNFVALTQTNLKRLLGYSSIAHTGYLLIGVLAGPSNELGYSGAIFYLAMYSVMNLGAFALLSVLAGRGDTGLNLHDLSGVSRKHPWLAMAMAIFFFSMAGIPPMGGFMAKYLLFYSAIQAHETSLVIIGVLCSAVSVYYYLRVLVYMYMREPVAQEGMPEYRVSAWAAGALVTMVLLTLQIGILPNALIDLAKKAVLSL